MKTQATGIIWSELMSRDPESSEKFYERVAGLKVVQAGEGTNAYRMFVAEGRPIGGLTGPRSDSDLWPSGGPSGHWVGYFASDDVSGAAAAAEKMGGKVLLGPLQLPGTGTVVVLSDPDGAAFGLFDPTAR